MSTTLTNLVTKTVTVNSAKLLTPADRIGSAVVARTLMAGSMSQGQNLLPRLSHPEPKPGGASATGARCHDSRPGYPWPQFAPDRFDRDCQSRDRSNANEANARFARQRAARVRMTRATRTAG
jgi:hypothetical protein